MTNLQDRQVLPQRRKAPRETPQMPFRKHPQKAEHSPKMRKAVLTRRQGRLFTRQHVTC